MGISLMRATRSGKRSVCVSLELLQKKENIVQVVYAETTTAIGFIASQTAVVRVVGSDKVWPVSASSQLTRLEKV
jgi:hypothetical protein